MTRGEALKLLKVSLSTIYNWADSVDRRGRKCKPKIRRTRSDPEKDWDWNDEDVYKLLVTKERRNNWNVIYARVPRFSAKSKYFKTIEQVKKDLKEQIARIQEYCGKNKIRISKIYTDIGYSGDYSRKRRPGLHNLIRDSMRKNIDLIIIESPDRIGKVGYDLLHNVFRYFTCRVLYINELPYDISYKQEVILELKQLQFKIRKQLGVKVQTHYFVKRHLRWQDDD